MAAATFKVRVPVRFADCDPAGIVFYPRYFEMINGVVEDWMATALNWSFSYLVMERQEGLPTVKIDCEFLSPSRMGDELLFELKVLKLGNSSLTLTVEAFNEGKPVLKSTNVLVYSTRAGEEKSTTVPDILRERLRAYLND